MFYKQNIEQKQYGNVDNTFATTLILYSHIAFNYIILLLMSYIPTNNALIYCELLLYYPKYNFALSR